MASELEAALVLALAEMPNVRKTGTGNYGKFAELHELIDAVRPVLAKHGLAFMQDVSGLPDGRLGVTTILVHTSGGRVATGPLPMPAPNDPQKVGSAITYARRYALMATLGLAAEDDDGQAAKPVAKKIGTENVRRGTVTPSLWDRVKATKAGNPKAYAALKAFETECGITIGPVSIADDPKFAEQLETIIKENT